MMRHLFSRFLEDPAEYTRAVQFWVQRWEEIAPTLRSRLGWRQPWVTSGGPGFLDGNPIFSAYSPILQKGIRIIQHGPTSNEMELEYWLDTFGGRDTDPESIRELVIACSLSQEAAAFALSLMRQWVSGPVAFRFNEPRLDSVPTFDTCVEPVGFEMAIV